MANNHVDVAVLGAGSAAETLAAELGSSMDVAVFEPERVGGECPFTACMPSKSLLHDAAVGSPWADAVARRREITHDLDDTSHVESLERHGALLVRASAVLDGPGRVVAGGNVYTAEHVVLATGAEPILPDLDGDVEPWTSDDVLTSDELPARTVIVGEGVIGCELAQLLARFGSQVTVVGMEKALFPELVARVGEIVTDSLHGAGVELVLGRTARTARSTSTGIELELDDGSVVVGDRVVVAVGKRARLHGLGLASVGLDETDDLPVTDDGRIDAAGSMWAIGDVAGKGQYTHLANHHARVVAANMRGGSRRFDEVALPRCVFTDPPVAMVGPTHHELEGDDDVVWRERPVTDVARATTDAVDVGHFALAARRSSGTLVAGHGVGPHFDELIHAITFAIDGRVPVHALTRSMQPFPTFGEMLGVLLSDLARDIGAVDPKG